MFTFCKKIIMRSLVIIIVLAALWGPAQAQDETRIRSIMDTQAKAWNRGDLEGFMGPYWKSDSLLFIGKSGVTYGWQATLDNYKRSYPDKAAMGELTFTYITFKKMAPDAYFVVGKWHLRREAGDLSGHFSLLLKKIDKEWKIVADHSS